MQAVSGFCISPWLQKGWFRLLIQETVSFCSVLTVKWSPTALLATWDSWGSHLASLTSASNLLEPPCKAESSFSWGDLSHSRWRGRSSPEDFSVLIFSAVTVSVCLVSHQPVFPSPGICLTSLSFCKKSFHRKSQHLVHLRPLPGWPGPWGLCSYESLTFIFWSLSALHFFLACSSGWLLRVRRRCCGVVDRAQLGCASYPTDIPS